ncbi:hypothetical protein AAMO2058_000053500 [Amorphochlora amoebiformis]
MANDSSGSINLDFLNRRQKPPKFPWKTLAMCIFLDVVGIVFIPVGYWELRTNGLSEALPFFILGVLGALPGFYHTVLFARAYMGHRGYRYELIPGAFEEIRS